MGVDGEKSKFPCPIPHCLRRGKEIIVSKFLYIDTETSGVDCEKNALIQLAGIIVINGEEKERFNFFIRPFPEDIILEKALEIGGFTEEQITTSPEFEEPGIVYKKFIKILGKYVKKFNKADKFTMFAYNSKFDMDFLRAWFKKNNDKYWGSWVYFPSICIMNQAAYKLMAKRHLLENFKLMTVAKFVGVELDETRLHDALYDIEISRNLLKKLHSQ